VNDAVTPRVPRGTSGLATGSHDSCVAAGITVGITPGPRTRQGEAFSARRPLLALRPV